MAELEAEGLDCLVLLNFQCTGITTVRRCYCCRRRRLPYNIDWEGRLACFCRPVRLGERGGGVNTAYTRLGRDRS